MVNFWNITFLLFGAVALLNNNNIVSGTKIGAPKQPDDELNENGLVGRIVTCSG